MVPHAHQPRPIAELEQSDLFPRQPVKVTPDRDSVHVGDPELSSPLGSHHLRDPAVPKDRELLGVSREDVGGLNVAEVGMHEAFHVWGRAPDVKGPRYRLPTKTPKIFVAEISSLLT